MKLRSRFSGFHWHPDKAGAHSPLDLTQGDSVMSGSARGRYVSLAAVVALSMGALSSPAQAQAERKLWDPVEEKQNDLSFATEGMTIDLESDATSATTERISVDGLRLASNPTSSRITLAGLSSHAPAADAGAVFKSAPIARFDAPRVSGGSTYAAPIAPAGSSDNGFGAGLVLPVSGAAGLMACGVLFAAFRPRS